MSVETSSGATLWCVFPMYRDSDAFLRVKEEISKDVRPRLLDLNVDRIQFVVVDDAAGDDPDISRISSSADTIILTPPHSLGHQRAIVFGLRLLTDQFEPNDIVVTLDSDGEDRPNDIPLLVERLFSSEKTSTRGTIVLAERLSRKTSLKFKLLYLGFKCLFLTLTGKVVKTGNFACFRSRMLKQIIQHPYFDLSYSSALLAIRAPRTFVGCRRGERYAGKSKMHTFALMIHGFRMLMPFIDVITMRLLTASALLGAFVIVLWAFAVYQVLAGQPLTDAFLVTLGVLSFITVSLFGNFLTLFTVLSRSDAITLKGIERRAAISTPDDR